MKRLLDLVPSPRQVSGRSVGSIMWNVVLALVPVAAFAAYAFGLVAVLGLSTAVAACLGSEWLVGRAQGRPCSLRDGSALITGLLYGLTLPPTLPLWMVALGGLLAIVVGKAPFGGLGKNCFNPALVGRALLQALFPAPMTHFVDGFATDRFASVPDRMWTVPLARPDVDVVSGATPLARFQLGGELTDVRDLALGMTGGSLGETCAVLILLGGGWLVLRGMMSWCIPAATLGTVAVLSQVLHVLDPARHAPAAFALTSGGLMLGAVLMATDPVASPLTQRGALCYGALIGTLVVLIRAFGALPEGVMYAILIGNAVTPHLDRWTRPRTFGTREKARVT